MRPFVLSRWSRALLDPGEPIATVQGVTIIGHPAWPAGKVTLTTGRQSVSIDVPESEPSASVAERLVDAARKDADSG